MLFMIYQVQYVFQINRKCNLNVFNMIESKLNQKHWQNIIHAIVNVNLMAENVIQIKSGIKNCVDMSVKIQ